MKILLADRPSMLSMANAQIPLLRRLLPGAEVAVCPAQTPQEMAEKAQEADGIITAFFPFDAALLHALPRCRCLSVTASGYGNIDVLAAKQLGILVCAVEEYCTDEVADHTMALLLSLARQLKPYDALVQQGQWRQHIQPPPLRLRGKTVGLFGLGRIAKAVAQRAQGFGLMVQAVSRHCPPAEAESLGIALVDEQTLLATSDIIINHMVQTLKTEGFFHKGRFEQMEKQPLFLNMSRGACVVEQDLAYALDRGWLRGAALDVLAGEPPLLARHPLLGRDNVLITPHAAYYSKESYEALERIPCENLAACLLGHPERAHWVVNA